MINQGTNPQPQHTETPAAADPGALDLGESRRTLDESLRIVRLTGAEIEDADERVAALEEELDYATVGRTTSLSAAREARRQAIAQIDVMKASLDALRQDLMAELGG